MALAPFKRIRPYVSPADEAWVWDRILAIAMAMSPEEREEYLEEPEPLRPPEVTKPYCAFDYGMTTLIQPLPADDCHQEYLPDEHICPECFAVERGLPQAQSVDICFHYNEKQWIPDHIRKQSVHLGHKLQCTRWRRYWRK